MNKFILTLSIILLAFLNSINAQENVSNPQCGYDVLVHKLDQDNPGYKDGVNQVFDAARRSKSNETRGDILVIPLVIHIVYQNAEQNISDTQINKVVKRLNEDYRHTNENKEDIRDIFKEAEGVPNIEFNLKAIERVSTNSTFAFDLIFGTFPDNVKQTANGGSDAYDVDTHLNIWVCHIEGETLLGYAYPPSCAPNWPDGVTPSNQNLDGVVIHHKAFNVGHSYTVQGTTIQIDGRTMTHEVGHYLGLRHIWGDGLTANFGIPDCSVDDGNEDTPNQGLPSSQTCSHNQNTCTDSSNDLPDMIENYMDYSDERCMSTFTNDQVEIMRNVLLDCRSGIVESQYSNIENNEINLDIKIYPNPSQEILHINMDNTSIAIQNLSFFNEIGQLIKPNDISLTSNGCEVQINNFTNGIYFIKLETSIGFTTKRIVVLK